MRYTVLLIAVCALLVGVLFVLGPAEGKTIIVDDDWPGADHSTISAAIAAASAGDTIRVYDGTYNEANAVGKSLYLVGNGTGTMIYGHKKDHTFGFSLLHGGCQVSGFHFYKWWPTHHYGAIGVFSDDNLIFDNTFHDNGRGIFFGRSRNNEIFNNTFDYGYYHILAREGTDEVRIAHNSFTKQYSSGILIQNSRGVEIFSNTFYNHTRCALTVSECSDANVSFNLFLACDDTSERRFGASLHLSSDVNVDNNTFIGHGRAIFAWGTTDLRIEHNTILDGEEGLYFSRTWVDRKQTGQWCNGTIVRNNNIMGQSRLGANATDGQVASIDARYNWWADASGPYHDSTNTDGLGVTVTDLIAYDPYLSSMVDDMPPVAIIHRVTPGIATEGDPITFMGRALARNVTTDHVWTSSIDGEIYHGTDVVFTSSDLSPGTHTITLRVRDTYGEWSEGVSVKLTVNGRPAASIKSISPPLVNDGELVTFVGVAFDHEDDIRRVLWESDIDGELGSELEFATSSLSNGTHVITLRVMDGYDLWSHAAVGEVVVNGRPRAFIDSIEHPLVNEGEPVILRGGYVDHEDGVVAFWWGSDIDGELSDQMIFYTASLTNGTHIITFRVKDDFQVWSRNVTATVVVNGLPRAAIEAISPNPAVQGEAVAFRGSVLDHEGSILEFEWTSDLQGTVGVGEDFTTSGLVRGTHVITFRVMDGHRVWSEPVVTVLHVNGRPTAWIAYDGPSVVTEGEVVHLQGGFEDPEGDVRGYLWESDLDGEVGSVWNLTSSTFSNGTHVISFRVRDGLGAWSEPATLAITVNGLPRCRILPLTTEWVDEGQEVTLTAVLEDDEGDLGLIEWSSDRDGALGKDGTLTTTGLSNGTHEITLRVQDGYGAWSEPATYTVKVNGRPRARIESVGPATTMEGQRVHFSGAGVDDLAVLEYRWTSSIDGELPRIAVFSTEDLSPGVHVISFAVADNRGAWSDPATVSISVEAIDARVGVEDIHLPDNALEGFEVTLGCTLVNTGNVPALGLSVRFTSGDLLIGVVDLEGPIHTGDRRAVEVAWTPVPGDHGVLVEVFRGGLLVCSGTPDGVLRVESTDGPGEPPTETPVPGENDRPAGVDDGNILLVLAVAISITVAVVYMIWTRIRAVASMDWEDGGSTDQPGTADAYKR